MARSAVEAVCQHKVVWAAVIGTIVMVFVLSSSDVTRMLSLEATAVPSHLQPTALSGLAIPRRIHHDPSETYVGISENIYVVSAWLDSRPILASHQPEITLLTAQPGLPFNSPANAETPTSELRCFVRSDSVGNGGAGPQRIEYKSRVGTAVLQDQHEFDRKLVTVMYTCHIDEELKWQASALSVALARPDSTPPEQAYLPVHRLPVLDAEKHRTGEGFGAVCLPPLSSDLYAPFLREYMLYYRALGFTRMYTYLLNPGPRTLKVIQAIRDEDDAALVPIRWSMPQAWIRSSRIRHAPAREFLVDPALWNLTGVETISEDEENLLGVPNGGDGDVDIWYYGQSAAQQDCAYRAMYDGARFVANVDYDEYLSLVPPHSDTWPAMDSSDKTPLDRFARWASALDRNWDGMAAQGALGVPATLQEAAARRLSLDVHGDLAAQLLPSALVLQSAFSCVKCQPQKEPLLQHPIKALGSDFDWKELDVSSVPLILQSPVRTEWIALPRRSKAVVDPWAWHSNVVHYPGTGYAQYALMYGPCSGSALAQEPAEEDRRCAEALLSVLGKGALAVQPVQNTEVDILSGSDGARGGVYHIRIDRQLSDQLGAFLTRDGRLSALTSSVTVPRMTQESWSKVRNWDWPASALVEDWTLAQVMSSLLSASYPL